MKYCSECGHELMEKECGIDGKIPYCPTCKEFRFPLFSSAISSITFNPDHTKVLLIQQYGKKSNVLVAGYINKGENAKETLLREMKEEVGLTVIDAIYNDNVYFEKSETLIHNYITTVASENFTLTDEVDSAQWFSLEDAVQMIKPNSLAKDFLFRAYHKLNLTTKLFHYEKERIYLNDSEDHLVAEITFPYRNQVHQINHTFVDPSLRGMGIAGKLCEEAYRMIKKENRTANAVCSYAIHWFASHPEKQDILI